MKIGDDKTPSCNNCIHSRWYPGPQVLACTNPKYAFHDARGVNYIALRAKPGRFGVEVCGPDGAWFEERPHDPR